MYEEFMRAILVVSTTFAGLTGVVIGQIMVSPMLDIRKKIPLKKLLAYCFALGFVSILFTVVWFFYNDLLWQLLAVIFFFFQLICFWFIVFRFWTT